MRFRVLGPLEVLGDDGDQLPIAGSKERTILAHLIARAGSVVSVDDLIEELWGERPPRTAEKTFGSHVSKLRAALEPGRATDSSGDVIATRGGGYQLELAACEIDAMRFEELAMEARGLLAEGRADAASKILQEALGLWRGAAYQGLRYTSFGASEGERLEELRRSSVEDRIDAELNRGSDGTLIAELEGMVREEPLRERRWGQLMLSLYRAGRQAEALDAYRRAREGLVRELGIEPGPALQEMQAAILRHDPGLDRAPQPTSGPAPADVCPYKGLARYERSDAEYFFGREQLVAEAVATLVSGRFLALVGASGSGKSSLLRAGVLHAIALGAVPGSDRWAVNVIRPGPHPLDSLASALRTLGPGRRVIAVDQFEETFTECADEVERRSFLDALTVHVGHPDGQVSFIVAIRADYYGRCAEHRGLASLLAGNQLLVGSMNADELSRTIELPADRAGLRIEAGLSAALLHDVAGRPGSLPLLSTTLLMLWQRRRDGGLWLEDYLRSGGVQAAVARLAEEAFGRLDAVGQSAARRILLRLAESGDGDEVVGRRASLTEFDIDRDADSARALAVLADARLITTGEGSVEVAHEALLREWPRLRDWLDEDAQGRRLGRNLTEIATAWDGSGRDEGDLYRGARLTAALDWADTHDPELNDLERDFLERSRAVAERQIVEERRANRRLRGLLAGVAVLLALSLIVGRLALTQRDEARVAAAIADARQLAARSLVEEDVVLSLLLAREAVNIYDAPETRSALLANLQRTPAVLARMYAPGGLSPPGDQDQWIEISPDGGTVVIGDSGPVVEFFDAVRYSPIGGFTVDAGTQRGTFSPDGTTLAIVTTGEEIVLVDVDTRTERARVSSEGSHVDAIGYASDGETFVSAEAFDRGAFLVPRDPSTLEPSGPKVRAHDSGVTGLAFASDGRWLVTTSSDSGETVLWDAGGLRPARSFEVAASELHPDVANDLALSPDGSIAALIQNVSEAGHSEGDVSFLDLRTGRVRVGSGGHQGEGDLQWEATGVAFTPDGRSVVTTGNDSRVLVWDVASATVRETLGGSADVQIRGPAISSDGTTAFTTDRTREVVVWDLTGDRRMDRPFVAGTGYEGWPWFAASPEGHLLAIMQADVAECFDEGKCEGSISLVDTSTLSSLRRIPYPRSMPQGVGFSSDGRTLAVGSWNDRLHQSYVRLWNVETGRPIGPDLPGIESGVAVWTMEFSPDGNTLAGGSNVGANVGGSVYLWNVATGELEDSFELNKAVNDLVFTPDGAHLVSVTALAEAGDIVYWDTEAHRMERKVHADDVGVWWTDISDDGRLLVTGGQSSGVQLWDPATGRRLGPPLAGLAGIADTVSISPDGNTVVAASNVGEILMWDRATRSILGRAFPGPGPSDYLAASFSPDGRSVVVVSDQGSGWVWNVDPADWEARACAIAGRSLTQAEWEVHVPGRPYHATCGP